MTLWIKTTNELVLTAIKKPQGVENNKKYFFENFEKLINSIIFGNAEGPYHYDPDQFQPEEWETKEYAFDRFVYKWLFASTVVAHWQAVASLKFKDEYANKMRLVSFIRDKI